MLPPFIKSCLFSNFYEGQYNSGHSINAFLFFFSFLLYSIVLVLPYINMNPSRVYTCSQSCLPLPPPFPYHLSGSSQCTSPKHLVSNLDWWFVSYMILYMFQCHSPKSSHPLPLPQSPKVCSKHLCLFCCLAYRVIITNLSKFHIYVLVYCIGVFLSGLLHSV